MRYYAGVWLPEGKYRNEARAHSHETFEVIAQEDSEPHDPIGTKPFERYSHS